MPVGCVLMLWLGFITRRMVARHVMVRLLMLERAVALPLLVFHNQIWQNDSLYIDLTKPRRKIMVVTEGKRELTKESAARKHRLGGLLPEACG